MDIKKLEIRLRILDNEIIKKFCSGKAQCYANLDQMVYSPGTIEEIQALCSRRNEIIELIEEECNAGNKAQKEETINADTTGVVG